jgi:hypothetical protein
MYKSNKEREKSIFFCTLTPKNLRIKRDLEMVAAAMIHGDERMHHQQCVNRRGAKTMEMDHDHR